MNGLACATGCRGNCRVSDLGAAAPNELERKALWRLYFITHANSRAKMQEANARAQAGDPAALEEVRSLTLLQAKLAECHPSIDAAIAEANHAGQWSPEWPRSAAELSRLAYEDDPSLGALPIFGLIGAVLAVFALIGVYLILRQIASIVRSVSDALKSPIGGPIIGFALLAGAWWFFGRRGSRA